MLEELDLSHNMLGDGTALMMGNILRHLPALAIINLSSCHMTQQYFFQHRMALAIHNGVVTCTSTLSWAIHVVY